MDKQTLKVDNPKTFVYDRFEEIDYSIAYEENKTTDNIVIDFIDQSEYFNNKCYRIIQRTIKNDRTLCEECSNKTSGKIHCDIQSYDGGLMFGTFYVTGGKSMKVIGTDDVFKIVSKYIKEKNEN